MKQNEIAIKNLLIQSVNNYMVDSLASEGGTLTENEAEQKAYIINNRILYFLFNNKLYKIGTNKRGVVYVGAEFNNGFWYQPYCGSHCPFINNFANKYLNEVNNN